MHPLQVRRHLTKIWRRLNRIDGDVADLTDRISIVERAVMESSAQTEADLAEARYTTAVIAARIETSGRVLTGEIG